MPLAKSSLRLSTIVILVGAMAQMPVMNRSHSSADTASVYDDESMLSSASVGTILI